MRGHHRPRCWRRPRCPSAQAQTPAPSPPSASTALSCTATLADGWPAVGGATVSSTKGQTARSFGSAGIESAYPNGFSESPSIVANDATLTSPPLSHTMQRHPRAAESYLPVGVYRFHPTTVVTRPPSTAQTRRTKCCARDSLSHPHVGAADFQLAVSGCEWWAA